MSKVIEHGDILLVVGNYYYYKDGREVKVIQLVDKLKRAEVIIGEWNPFWVNYSDLTLQQL